MSEDNITELGAHEPSVESVISRLSRFEDRIKHITAVIDWNDGSSDVFHDTKDVSAVCYDAILLTKYAGTLIHNKEDQVDE